MKYRIIKILVLPILFLTFSCDRVKEDPLLDEMVRFNAWIDYYNLGSYKTPSGIYLINEKEGTGEYPKDSDIVMYSYVLRNIDGAIYQGTYKDTAIIHGYETVLATKHYTPEIDLFLSSKKKYGRFDGISKMKQGGKVRLIMPSTLAPEVNYNHNSLIYDIELLKVFDGSQEEFEQLLIDEYIAADTAPESYIQMDTIYYKNIYDDTYYKTSNNSAKLSAAVKGDSVWVYYTGKFLDGFVFDTNEKNIALANGIYNSTYSYTPLKLKIGENATVPGFEFALKQANLYQRILCIIPSKYAYGTKGESNGDTPIPANTPLVFEIRVMKIVQNTSTISKTHNFSY